MSSPTQAMVAPLQELSLAKELPHILFVEDDPEVVTFLNRLLAYLGYQVSHVPDGAAALDWLHQQSPDIIITDILMPNMDGLRFCESLRHNPRTCLIPVIILSAKAELHERLAGFRAGADDYIVKPFDVLELKARLESILLRSQREIWCNPLSHLPGSPGIEAEVNRRLEEGRPFAFAYIDIDDFKPYNDVYGYHAGDQVIKILADLLMDVSNADASAEAYCGHIGGDDFVFMSAVPYMMRHLPKLLRRFDAMVPSCYSPEDNRRGGIQTPDRQGQDHFFPKVRLSAAVINSTSRPIRHYAQLSEIASELKHKLKSQAHPQGSCSLWDSRTENPPETVV